MFRVAACSIARKSSVGISRTAPAVSRLAVGSDGSDDIHRVNISSVTFANPPQKKPEAKEVGDLGYKLEWWNDLYLIPIGFTLAVPAVHFEWLQANPEMQLAGAFIGFCAIAYTQGGDMLHKEMTAAGDKILEEQNALEDAAIQALEGLHKDMEAMKCNHVEEYGTILKMKDEAYDKLNAAGQIKPLYDLKSQVERTLNMIQQEETNMMEKGKVALMAEATETVTAKFSSSNQLKKAALDLALAKIQGTAKPEDDPVKATFIEFFKEKAAASANTDSALELATQREAMVAKLNAVASNEGFFFNFEKDGKPKMGV